MKLTILIYTINMSNGYGYRQTSGGGGGGLAMAAAQVINGTVDTLFKNKVYKSQAERNKVLSQIDKLDNQQKYVLAQQLQDAKDDNEKLAILSNYAATIKSDKKTLITALIFLGGSVLLFGVVYLIKVKRKPL